MRRGFEKLCLGLAAFGAVSTMALAHAHAASEPYAVTDETKTDADAEIRVPAGFDAEVIASDLGAGRHIVVRQNGDIYLALRKKTDGHGIVALRDADGDGKYETIERFGDHAGTGIDIYKGYLYFGSDTTIYRYKLADGKLLPDGDAETIISGFPEQRQHASKPFTFDGNGKIYVNSGGPSNACQEQMRTPGSPGQAPCPQLERGGGIWQFDAEKPGQTQEKDGHRYATGLRNSMGIAWNHNVGHLYAATHGRDQLSHLWPDYFNAEDNANLPAEELHLITDGGNYGWPYTYYHTAQQKRLVAPEYGGDGHKEAEAGKYGEPIMAFPAHWAPNDLIFYTGDQFPEYFRNGAFIAFHGSWNRAPHPQEGYRIVFAPFSGETPSGDYQTFADGFPGVDPISSPRQAKYRPTGIAEGPDGSLYIADSSEGRIWRVRYVGE